MADRSRSAGGRSGASRSGTEPVLSVFDDRRREISLLGQEGDDLVLRLRRRASPSG